MSSGAENEPERITLIEKNPHKPDGKNDLETDYVETQIYGMAEDVWYLKPVRWIFKLLGIHGLMLEDCDLVIAYKRVDRHPYV